MNVNIADYLIVTPRIVSAHTNVELTLKPRFGFEKLSGMYEVAVIPKYYYFSDDRTADFDTFTLAAEENCLRFKYHFEEEQEYTIAARIKGVSWNRRDIMTAVYALEKDLYNAIPLKGDLHMHTTFSDGIESPEHRVMEARKNGFDFMAVTDHNNFGGSIATRSFIDKIGLDMVAVLGEEIHALNCPSHILSLGAKHSIVSEVTVPSQELTCRRERIKARYQDLLPENVEIESFAAAMDVFDRIREAGGMSVLCHIYWDAIDWTNHRRFGAPQQLADALTQHLNFDAFELTSGAPKSDLTANYLQAAYYHDKLPADFPIIGITDTHCTLEESDTIFGKNFTLIFADEKTENGIIDAIRRNRSVCVDGVSDNVILRGPVRLCKYAKFLINHFYPLHDELLMKEGISVERILECRTNDLGDLRRNASDTRQMTSLYWKGLRT